MKKCLIWLQLSHIMLSGINELLMSFKCLTKGVDVNAYIAQLYSVCVFLFEHDLEMDWFQNRAYSV